MGGYKAMLRDKTPFILDLALKWCNAKGRWIDHVYNYMVKKYPQQKRGNIVKIVLGLKKACTKEEIHDYYKYVLCCQNVTKEKVNSIPNSLLYMPFKDTIDWDSYKDDEYMYNYWYRVNEWVEWFKSEHAFIENSWRLSKNKPQKEHEMVNKYGFKLAKYLINSFE